MPLDRRIQIQRDHGDYNDDGEFIHDWRDVARVWAVRQGVGASDTIGTGGTALTVENVTFTIRYTSTLATLNPARVRVVDDESQTWSVDVIAESDARRRFLSISAVRAF